MQVRARRRKAFGCRRRRRWTRWCAFACAALWLAVAGPGWALDPAVALDRYTVTRWTVDAGLPHNQVHDIGQAADGFLWVATWEGAARFEGHQFRTPGDPSGLLPSRALLRDGDAMLVGGIQAGLWRFPANGAPVPLCAGHPRLDVWTLARAAPDLLWVATNDGLYRVDGAGDCRREDGAAEALQGQLLMSLLVHPDGSLWIGGLQGLYRDRDGQLQEVGAAKGLPPGAVRGLALDGDGAVWLAGDRGVWRHDGRRLQRLREDSAEAMLQDRHGAQWVVTAAGEVLRHRDGRWEWLDAGHGLLGRGTGALFEDREGLLWVGTTHGLFRIADGPAWGIGRQQGLGDDFVRSVLQTADGSIWAGHAGGLSRWRDGRFQQVFPARPGEPGSSVLSLARAGDGGVWIGTYNRGVLRMGPEADAHVRPLIASAALPVAADSVRAVLEDASGGLWIGTERGVSQWHGGDAAPVALAGAPALPVRVIRQANDGGLWIGMLGALVRRAADGGLRIWLAEQDMPADSVLDIHPDPDGSLWLATNRGVMQLRDGGFVVHERQGIPASAVFRILDDGLGNFWFSGNRGLFRVPRASFDQVARGERGQLELAMFGPEDGLPSRQVNGGSAPAGWTMADGHLWIPTAAGVAVIDPARVQREQRERVPLVIDRVQIDGVDQLRGAPGVVPPASRLTIDFAGVSLRQPGNLRYRYRMHGFDRGWVDAGTARSVSYTNLPPGDMRFEVQVVLATADWETPAGQASMRFRVDAPWWRQPWMLGLGVLAVLGLLLAMHFALGRHQRQRQHRLQRLVDRRTEELRDKNRQLELATRQLERQASHDPLTDLPNRRAGDRFLAEAITRARVSGAPLCVALVDVDRFKQINDRHGHQAGDQVLARVAERLRDALVRADDDTFVGRHGGEEFLVVMPARSLDEAVRQLDAARGVVSAPGIHTLDGSSLSCTISVGVVEVSDGVGSDGLLQVADARLYEAKRRGRNQVVAD